MFYRFENREEGGRALAEQLADYKNRKDVMVLALPRGGVPVGFEVAKALNLPLDVFVVRKLGVPNREELAFGAIASGGIIVLNNSIIRTFKVPDSLVRKVIERETAELQRRENLYGLSIFRENLQNKTVIIIDDGIATGATIKAALTAVRQAKPMQIIIASPVASTDVCENINRKPDTFCICVMTPEPFNGVGMWYRGFQQTRDAEVCEILKKAEVFCSRDNLRKAA